MQTHRTFTCICALLIVLAGVAVFGTAGSTHAQQQVTIDGGDFWFCDPSFEEGTCETVITAGDTVVWDFSSGINSHTATDCGGSCDTPSASQVFDSGTIAPGGTFSFTFDDPGSYPYLCSIHPTLMFGRIVVQEAAGPEPATQTPSLIEPGDIIPPGSTPLGGLPTSGQGPSDDASSPVWFVLAAVAGGGALLALIGATGHRRTR